VKHLRGPQTLHKLVQEVPSTCTYDNKGGEASKVSKESRSRSRLKSSIKICEFSKSREAVSLHPKARLNSTLFTRLTATQTNLRRKMEKGTGDLRFRVRDGDEGSRTVRMGQVQKAQEEDCSDVKHLNDLFAVDLRQEDKDLIDSIEDLLNVHLREKSDLRKLRENTGGISKLATHVLPPRPPKQPTSTKREEERNVSEWEARERSEGIYTEPAGARGGGLSKRRFAGSESDQPRSWTRGKQVSFNAHVDNGCRADPDVASVDSLDREEGFPLGTALPHLHGEQSSAVGTSLEQQMANMMSRHNQVLALCSGVKVELSRMQQ
jgi:hypothetical protein